jgi:hypothetical protein
MSIVERKVYDHELKFHLSHIKFHKFRAAVKKYGHCTHLKDYHMHAISDLIRLNIDELSNNPRSTESLIYRDPLFTFDLGNYDPYKLLLIGYLYCHFDGQRNI